MDQNTPFGSWRSPITADLIVSETIGLGLLRSDGEDLYWVEARPKEKGRCVVVRRTPNGNITDVTPPPYNVRSRVHEYGGGEFFVHEGTVYFSNFSDQRLYRQKAGAAPEAITPDKSYRYADGIFDTHQNRLILVREDHTEPSREAVNTLVSIDLSKPDEGTVLTQGHDFYAFPRLSPDCSQLAWISWDHPNMPWDQSSLSVAKVKEDGFLEHTEKIASGDESVFQPEWSPDGRLHFVSDRNGWWNLYRWDKGRVESLCTKEADFGRPLWQFGMSTYAFLSSDQILCTFTQNGLWFLSSLDTHNLEFKNIETPYTDIDHLVILKNGVACVAASPSMAAAVVYQPKGKTAFEVLRSASKVQIDSDYISKPRSIKFPTSNESKAYGFYYPPQNKDYAPKPGAKPPLLVISHGGPTSSASSGFGLKIQYWTSRGFAVLDVNYRGSTGFGRAYRKQLENQWGIADVDDCVYGAQYLVKEGLADADRLAIRGGSAGGYTTLCALTFRDIFKAGASYYGIGDLEALVRDTHKFESHYPDRLVGPYPKDKAVYRQRSPIHFTDSLSCPVIFFQGLEDKVVPPNQAEMMVKALKKKGIPVEYVSFEEEQHGFRKAENIKTTLERELSFYGKVFQFNPAMN